MYTDINADELILRIETALQEGDIAKCHSLFDLAHDIALHSEDTKVLLWLLSQYEIAYGRINFSDYLDEWQIDIIRDMKEREF